jgi:hypothetical protein
LVVREFEWGPGEVIGLVDDVWRCGGVEVCHLLGEVVDGRSGLCCIALGVLPPG